VTRKKAVSTLGLAVGAVAGQIRVHKSDDTVVAIAVAVDVAVAVAIAVAVSVAVEVQSKVCCGFEILEHSLCSGHMAGEWTRIVSAESSDCI